MSAPHSGRDLQTLAIRGLLYPLWAKKNGSARLRYTAELEESQFWPAERLHAHQAQALTDMIGHAARHCAYYRERFAAEGIQVEDLRLPGDLRRLPLLTKETVQVERDRMVSDQAARGELLEDMTGGSTGSPMRFFYSRDRLDSREAAALRHNRWAGWDRGDRAAALWGAPRDVQAGAAKDRIRNWILTRSLILDASRLDDRAMAEFASRLKRYRPRVLLAYANTVALFARYVRDNGIEGIRPQAVICSAEVLTPENRALIESTFHCPVFNRYGSREFSVIASECDRHVGMDVNAENLYVEVLVDGEPVVGKPGEIVVTDLKNTAMPMIRYRTRDVGTLLEAPCRCGRSLPLLEISGGRVTDFLIAGSGARGSGIVIATYVITSVPGAQQVQLHQKTRGAVTVRVVRGKHWAESSADVLVKGVREYLGADTQVEIEYCSEIPLQASGKHRFSICEIET